MTMNENEIVRSFKEAKKKREQIGILAELNSCSRDKIRDILIRNGISEAELPLKPGKRRAAETEVFSQQIKKNHAKPEEFRSGKPEPEEAAVPETTEEELPLEETSENVRESSYEVPESVKEICRHRIWVIGVRVDELRQTIEMIEKEKRELQAFLAAIE